MEEKEINDWLRNLSVVVDDPDFGFRAEYKGFKNILKFAQSEADFWTKGNGKVANISTYVSHFRDLVNQLNSLQQVSRNVDEQTLNQRWTGVESKLRSTSPKTSEYSQASMRWSR